ncbi:DUF1272 domain-containing protein [Asticcacaulis sp. AND118]|uniref:DUF1272 domain-containing protein n=1 Tax=Asticcacaulis sp. AND118 TaxID=2840468 RepID=UPI001D001383|nr:DUF1272 domain-containing protein [Asticcacaulis sp. AND118]UDF02468.1 DUF1272 domain-containing protein [Asticcacaulis sp. AND118]
MLEMKPGCETCGAGLLPETSKAFICSYECTYCVDCTVHRHGGRCPNCGGELLRRPARQEKLEITRNT